MSYGRVWINSEYYARKADEHRKAEAERMRKLNGGFPVFPSSFYHNGEPGRGKSMKFDLRSKAEKDFPQFNHNPLSIRPSTMALISKASTY